MGQVRHRRDVDLEHRVDLVHVLLFEQPPGHPPCVVEQDVDLLVQARPGLLDRLLGGHVHAHGHQLAGVLEPLGQPRAGEDPRAGTLGDLVGQRAADAAVGSRDENGGA